MGFSVPTESKTLEENLGLPPVVPSIAHGSKSKISAGRKGKVKKGTEGAVSGGGLVGGREPRTEKVSVRLKRTTFSRL